MRRHPDGALRAPISGRPCVAFQAFIDEHNGKEWITRIQLQEARPFVVVDESGTAMVDTSGPFELALVTDEQASTGVLGRMGPAQLQAVKSYLKSRRKVRYREGILKEGRKVAIGGSGNQEISGDARPSGTRGPPQWLVLRGTAEEPLLISNWSEALGGRWAFGRESRVDGRA